MVEWTTDALKELIETRFDALDDKFDKLREADLESLRTALNSANEKAKTHNDILGAMKEQQTTFFTKEASESLAERVKKLEDAAIKHGGGADRMERLGGMIVQAITTAAAVVGGIQLLN